MSAYGQKQSPIYQLFSNGFVVLHEILDTTKLFAGYSVSMHIGPNGFMTRVGLSYQDPNQGLLQLTVGMRMRSFLKSEISPVHF